MPVDAGLNQGHSPAFKGLSDKEVGTTRQISEKGVGIMKKRWLIVVIGFFLMFPVVAHAQVDKFLQGFLGKPEESVRPEQLTVTRLEFLPDPVPEGRRFGFRATISNASQYSVTLPLGIADRNKIISATKDATLRPGNNQIDFPEISYQLSGTDYCFTLETIVDRSRVRINMAREFCANSTRAGWTLSDRMGDRDTAQLHVEDLQMSPDPVSPGQEFRFTVRLSNDGKPMRGHIMIQDRDQVVARIDNASILRGSAEYQFPRSRYAFQRSDTCLQVSVDLDGTLSPVRAWRKEYCVYPVNWTLKPVTREHIDRKSEHGERGR
jgi:hypothetical protein